MIVLTTNSSQTLSVIPREYLGSFTIDVRDASLNKTFSYFEIIYLAPKDCDS